MVAGVANVLKYIIHIYRAYFNKLLFQFVNIKLRRAICMICVTGINNNDTVFTIIVY